MATYLALEPEDLVYYIEAETSPSIKRLPFYVVAEGMEIIEEKVFFYK